MAKKVTVHKSAKNGQFVSPKTAAKSPSTTYKTTVRKGK